MAIAFLSLNIKFRHLFGSIGAGYISAYEIILIFGVSSYSISIILVVAAISGILTISKFNDFLLNCFVRATLVPFCFLLAVNSILMNVFVKLHFKDSYRMVTFPIAVCLGLGILLCFAMVFFQREIKEKVEELRSNADEKVEKVDDEDKAKEAI
ncbi:hypothetical protein PAEPH01_0549 [Pancytospora epiphaga]|nr:hypothetical protein PAEPH01_0549 [Pancytospora epiphaga]